MPAITAVAVAAALPLVAAVRRHLLRPTTATFVAPDDPDQYEAAWNYWVHSLYQQGWLLVADLDPVATDGKAETYELERA